MVMQLKTPDAPATSKQLWLLHILTKTDTRNLNITMAEASKQIEQLKTSDKTGKTPPQTETVKPERSVIQGKMPTGETDMDKVRADFMLNAYPIGRARAGNETARIGFYDFNCKECLFGKTGTCKPDWDSAGFTTCAGKIEAVSFDCNNYEPVEHRISDYCKRPRGKQCHRKNVDNCCLECGYRTSQFIDAHNRSAWCNIIPTIEQRIKYETERRQYFIDKQSDKTFDYTSAIKRLDSIIDLLNQLKGGY